MKRRHWLSAVLWIAIGIALVVAIAGELMPVPQGDAATATGYAQGDVTLYEGVVSSFDITTDVLPGCVCHSAQLTLSTGAPQILFGELSWTDLPPIKVGDHVRVWTNCSNGCDSSPHEALKVVSSRTTALSDVAQYDNVDFSPESGSWQALAHIAGPVAGALIGLFVFVVLLLTESSRLVAISVGSAMIAGGAVPQLAGVEFGVLVICLALTALVSGTVAWTGARRRQLSASPYGIVSTLAGGALFVLVSAALLLAYWLAPFGARPG